MIASGRRDRWAGAAGSSNIARPTGLQCRELWGGLRVSITGCRIKSPKRSHSWEVEDDDDDDDNIGGGGGGAVS